MTFIQNWWESMNDSERFLLYTSYPTLLVAIVAGYWLFPRVFRRIMGFNGNSSRKSYILSSPTFLLHAANRPPSWNHVSHHPGLSISLQDVRLLFQ